MSIYDIDVDTIEGRKQSMAAWRGKTLLVVNVASKCGLTPQYEGLQALHEQYKDRGFAVLGFPCDQFGHQEPGSEAEISSFCELNYGVGFPMFSKIEVNGEGAHPLYKLLKTEQKGADGAEAIKWNFAKFLVGPDGAVVKRYEPQDTPASVGADLAGILK